MMPRASTSIGRGQVGYILFKREGSDYGSEEPVGGFSPLSCIAMIAFVPWSVAKEMSILIACDWSCSSRHWGQGRSAGESAAINDGVALKCIGASMLARHHPCHAVWSESGVSVQRVTRGKAGRSGRTGRQIAALGRASWVLSLAAEASAKAGRMT